ncbi:leucine-rich repeat and calponin homology domain-containing protein 1-like isoform X2 [Daphnia carinata]|uniref:leucine-rich repeat and calponin homology domain-containing protein 1-like isoform X2 n=1 Tax=Daphnia carinata TaxID=120202 RepID=UPI002868593F|nr:leucine-rich repeat and calponin homology domain-containing protein 1-like isoform X2 [Daphnia carinata]
MAGTVGATVGPQSPLNRNLERLLEEAQISGELRVSSRRLREFPKVASKYNLNDTVYSDLSKNKLSELPNEITRFTALEKLNLYHNVIRFIPETVMYLQCLTYLDISRNQLSVLPAYLCKLPLQVLLVSHNRLVSLPEEINQLAELIELDASCNQLSHLPIQLGDLQHLESLNLRKNFLVELPRELMFLQLVTLDISVNRISALPVELRYMVSLVDLCVEHNPLSSPPAHLCTRGRIHIFKYLEIEAIKEDRKRDILEGGDCRRLPRKPSTLPDSRFSANDPRRKRYTIDNSNGFANCNNSSSKQPVVADGLDMRWPQQSNQQKDINLSTTETAPSFPPAPLNHNHPVKTEDEDDDEQGNEERRRAARKILEHQMASQDDQRLPNHGQTYREYKEALRQQRSNVYKGVRDNSHTPSPDTPPLSGSQPGDYGRQLLLQMPQQQPQQRPEGFSPFKPWESNSNQTPVSDSSTQPHPSSFSLAGDFTRPLSLNLSHDENNKMNVKAVQKEAVLSYVKAKTSPSSVAQPPPFRSPTSELLSPTLPFRSTPVVPSSTVESNNVTPPYRPPPTEPINGSRKIATVKPGPSILSRQNSLTNSTNGNQTPPPSNHLSHTAATASFTVRREMERQREEMEQIQHLRQCIEMRLKVSLPDDLSSALQDGVVLCHLANHVRPRSVASIHVPSPAVPKLTVAKCRRNVENFIEACRRIGVPEDRLCTSADVLERRSVVRIATTVATLMAFHRGRPVTAHYTGV